MHPHIFVYGTLMPHAVGDLGATERTRLAREGTILGPATTLGKLIDLGAYPGLIAGTDTVPGIVYALRDPDMTLAWLDDYEGITGQAHDEYRRELRAVTLSSGTTISCWTYTHIQPKDEAATQ